MSIITFGLNIEKDIENIWRACNIPCKWHDPKENVPNKIISICHNKTLDQVKEELIKINSKLYSSDLIKSEILFLNQLWETIEAVYFKRLEIITRKPFPYKKINAYLTTISRCPYNPDPKYPYFFVSVFAGIPKIMATAGHELLHLHFHYYYWKAIEQQIGRDKTADLKEALTELLNLEFQDLWLQYDKGYEPHKELRSFIKQEWQKSKDFDNLLKSCVNFIKMKTS